MLVALKLEKSAVACFIDFSGTALVIKKTGAHINRNRAPNTNILCIFDFVHSFYSKRHICSNEFS